MERRPFESWEHDHTFGQDAVRAGERRTAVVIAITGTMMVVEIIAGIAFGSMALLADGLHMASHTVALGITMFAYVYARRHARDPRYSFGTGKVNALAGFSSAVLLVVFAVMMVWESVERFVHPIDIRFDQAVMVAVIGLAVNAGSAVILSGRHETGHHHGHDHAHHHDHNLRSAYFHVLADAMTSVFAIAALLAGKYFGFVWMDPMMGVVGAVLVARWSWGLLRDTSGVLLDRQGPSEVREQIRDAIENHDGTRIVDLHVWSIGPGIFTGVISVVADDPLPPEHYKQMLPSDVGLVHVTVEVHEAGAVR